MKWLLIGGAVAGAGLLLLANGNHGGGSPNFGMAMAADPAYRGNLNGAYGMAMYGGFNSSGLKPKGYWQPATLQRYQ